MPWFGMDIGGTLTKLVYFEPNEDEPEVDQDAKIIQKIRHYLTKNAAYGDTGHRDIHLQVSSVDFVRDCFKARARVYHGFQISWLSLLDRGLVHS